MQETEGSAFPVPDVNCQRELEFSVSSDLGSDHRLSKVSKDVQTTDLNETVTQEHGILRVIGTATAKDMDRNFCGIEENGKVQGNTVTGNRPTFSSGIEKEIKDESTAECDQGSSLNTEIHTNCVCPVEFTSLQMMAVGCLKDKKTEAEVVAPTDVFDDLFQDYVNKLNVTAKANYLRVAISDDECGFIASSSATESYEEAYFQEIQVHKEGTQGALIKKDVSKKEEECREGLNTNTKQSDDYSLKSVNGKRISFASGISNICKEEFRHHNHLKEHMTTHPGEKAFKCSFCDKNFRLEIHLLHHMITHKEMRNLLSEAHDSETEINVPLQLTTGQDMKKTNQDSSKAEEKIIQDYILSSINCTTLVEQLPDNTGLVESNIHHSQLEDGQLQTKHSLPMARSELAATNPDSPLGCTNSRLLSARKSSSGNVYNKVVPENLKARNSSTTKTKSSHTKGKGYPTKAVSTKRISLASGIVYEDKVSSPEELRCSSTAQTLHSSTNSEAAEEVPVPSSRQSNNKQGTSSSGFSHVGSMVSSKLPPGSTLVSDRGVFCITDIEKPFACGYCGKTYKKKHAVYVHIINHHNEKRYSCEFCGKSYSQQCDLDLHVRIHTQEKPFTCDQCGMQFRLKGSLRRHKFIHSEERPFCCKQCNKSFKSSDVLARHSEIHNKEQRRQDIICNICKMKFRIPSILKKHMMIHTGEKPFRCSLCDKHFRLKIDLGYHMNTHSGKKRYKSCSVCGKSVSANYMLTHMRMHTGEKPFECNICGKRFLKKQILEGHIRSHTGEKPFACSRCDRRFALYSTMVHHKAKCTGLSVNVAEAHC